jgi:hypothetical protein
MTRESVKTSPSKAGTLGLQDQGATLDLKLCHACASEVRPRDHYCRRCGASQTLAISSVTATLTEPERGAGSGSFVTAPLDAPVADKDAYHQVSGSLVRAITAGLSSSASARLGGRHARRVMLALISIPIWLIIILLSPLDAYATARTVIGPPQDAGCAARNECEPPTSVTTYSRAQTPRFHNPRAAHGRAPWRCPVRDAARHAEVQTILCPDEI